MPVVKSKAGLGCPVGFKPEFNPVHDMHLGVVTSSLGTRLSDAGLNGPTNPLLVLCKPSAMTSSYPTISAHNDDKGELISRGPLNLAGIAATEGIVGDATVGGYLYWFPTAGAAGPAPALSDASTFETDFGSIVSGAGIFGCGIESQLESWYRFLIQPDPYASLVLNGGKASWSGVDTAILKQRHDFLRPDSLVAVVVLSDENDSEIDVRSLNGQGYLFMHEDWDPPHGTSACAINPDDPSCFSCPPGSVDPNCGIRGFYSATNDWGFDPNLRHVHMQAKYGLDAQFPIGRYYLGLTSAQVPNRIGEYPPGAGNYVGCLPDSSGNCVANCTNPLFASALPDGTGALTDAALCNLPVGQRSSQDVFYVHIGGVPSQLLHFDSSDLTHSQLTAGDWVKILGKSAADYVVGGAPLTHDYSGIDPQMIEDYRDRTTVQYSFMTDSTGTNALSSSTAASTADRVNGREWVTDQSVPTVVNRPDVGHVLPVDLEYACIFPLAAPRDCTLASNQNSCDCPSSAIGLTPGEIPPVCDPNSPTSQIAAKAYPTARELLLAKLMSHVNDGTNLPSQSIVASLCPVHQVDNGAGDDPFYAYRPAVVLLVDRVKNALNR